jgi:hypothetical protein
MTGGRPSPWLRLLHEARWTALRNLDRVRPELRPFVRAHLRRLEAAIARFRRAA